MLHEHIKEEIKHALRERNGGRLMALRNMLAAFTNELVAKRRKPQETLHDEDALSVIMRLARQRKESITAFKKGEREDLVAKEEAELAELEKYLPVRLPRGDLEELIKAKINQLGITSPSEKGKLMGVLMKDLKGKADGETIKEIVDQLVK